MKEFKEKTYHNFNKNIQKFINLIKEFKKMDGISIKREKTIKLLKKELKFFLKEYYKIIFKIKLFYILLMGNFRKYYSIFY